ncbi:helicase-related protein [Ornithinimicrobium pratense]|uniref:SWF/SNF helicase family protein n=1 Tax=Ornithinimicrobium pratense TaxID=2593973 RepID=A0A5J6V807_9MICO|nr:helicase-related protein [Ornithinimicrobium pratense]QFG69246.1 SWF/SNF helicase family protein [Ornithinimicrobium pratense]
MTDDRPDLEAALSGLKDFQRRTVDAAFERLWGDDDPSSRFLVADEVGLGKTLVARGVLAKTVDHLWDHADRIDIVYICSNSQIAQQNLRRLHAGLHGEIPHADRLTMLPTVLDDLDRQRVNVISFTPGTSFHLGNSGGQAPERALLFVMLERAWGAGALRGRKWSRFFQGAASEERMRREIDRARGTSISPQLMHAFSEALLLPSADGPRLCDALGEGADDFRWLREGGRVSWQVSAHRYRLIGQLRQALARICVSHLQPDLVILDEFQRFSQLLSGDDDASRLVQSLLGPIQVERPGEQRTARTLLLSATPFKMYTLPDEPEGDDHYRDFLHTVRVLAGPERAQIVQDRMSEMRAALLRGDVPAATDAKDVAQVELRRVMARTERLAATKDRDGMLTSRQDRLTVTRTDVSDYLAQAAVARALDSPEGLEYWRSSPHVLEMMERYHVKRRIDEELTAGSGLLRGILRTRFTPDDLHTYGEIDPGNPRARWLADDVLSTGAWRAAWLAPSLPYYTPRGIYAEPAFQRFTKRLVFSAWGVAPKGIATTLSYEVERRLAGQSPTMRERGYFATRRRGLLTRTVTDGRLTGMPVLALLYPCVELARAGDPLRVARDLGRSLPLDREDLVAEVRKRVERSLEQLPSGGSEGVADQRWFWAAPLLLDRLHGLTTVEGLTFGGKRLGDQGADGFGQHLDEALHVDAAQLGPRPAELADVLTELALSGPAVCALRTLARVVADPGDLGARDVRATASEWAWSLRSLFNGAEIMAVVEGQGDDPYWRRVLQHGMDGNLQSVLDEYGQVLHAAHSLAGHDRPEQLRQLGEKFAEGSGLLASPQAMDFFADGVSPPKRRRIRTHFAARYGRAAAVDDKTVQRETQVREAFNSPFWPFVLASTSVGQEGLDFHHYSHAVVHWNLPSNPVDLEQREGRVHRYRGHAVRKNVAQAHSGNTSLVGGPSPWPVLFDLAADERGDRSEIFPDWVYPLAGGATIERHVPVLPMSRGTQHYQRLLRTVGAYRLTLGQPRQEELIAYVGDNHDLALDLTP